MLALARVGDASGIPEAHRAAMRWEAEQLSDEQADAIASWPETVRIEVEGLGGVLFCHATPRSDSEIFTRETPEGSLRAIFEAAGASVVVCGHTHMAFDRMIGDVRVVNAGSVGMPFGEDGAHWLRLGPGVEPRRTTYDAHAAGERIRACGHPGAEEFVAQNVLSTPLERDMLDMFRRAELRA